MLKYIDLGYLIHLDKIFDYYIYLSSNDDGVAPPDNSLVKYNKADQETEIQDSSNKNAVNEKFELESLSGE